MIVPSSPDYTLLVKVVKGTSKNSLNMHMRTICGPHLWRRLLSRLREGQKSDLVKCMEKTLRSTAESPVVDVAILDGAVVVQMASTGAPRTFQEYADNVFHAIYYKTASTSQKSRHYLGCLLTG